MDFDPATINYEEQPRHELILDITDTAQQLISQLRIQREPNIERVILTLDMDDRHLPDFIQRNISPDTHIPVIVVDGTVNRLTKAAQVDIRVESENMDMLMNISSVQDGGEPSSSMITLKDLEELPLLMPPSRVEINRFLASLFVKNKTGDYSAFDAMDLGNHETTDRLLVALKDVADEVITEEEYFSGATVGATADSIRFTEWDGTLHSAIVTIEHHAKGSAAEISFTQQQLPGEFDEDLDEPEFMMQDLEGVRTFAQDIDGESRRVASSNEFLIVVRDFLKEQKDSVFARPDDSEFDESEEDGQLKDSVFFDPEIVELPIEDEDDQQTYNGAESDSADPLGPSRRATDFSDPSLEINIEDLRTDD